MYRQKSFENDRATLYLVPTPIGNLSEMTSRALEVLHQVHYIAAEDTRNTVKLCNHFEISAKLISHHEHNLNVAIPKILSLLEEGEDVAIVSDAGYPAISDPGYEIVKEAIAKHYNVVPISGCNAALDALVVSGIAPQPFLFYGFLAHDNKTKKKELEKLKHQMVTIIFYEAPHRITKTLNLMLEILGDRQMSLCRELTKRHEEIIRGRISEILEIAGDLRKSLRQRSKSMFSSLSMKVCPPKMPLKKLLRSERLTRIKCMKSIIKGDTLFYAKSGILRFH